MRKVLLLSALLATFGSAIFAKHIDETTAKRVGHSFILNGTNSHTLKTVKAIELVYKSSTIGSMPTDKSDPTTFFYVFNAGASGFVIVAGDDNVSPILGYSDEGAFDPDNIPQNTQKWLEGYKAEIRYVVEHNIDATDEIKEEWGKWLSAKQTDFITKSSVSPS